MNRRLLTLAALSSCVAASALAPLSASAWEVSAGSWGNRLEGSGKMVDEQRALPAFSRLRVVDALDVKARFGSKNGVTVHADDNILPLIVTAVEGDTLIIKTKSGTGFRSRGPISIQVEFTQLSAVSMQGSGDLEVEGVRGEAFDASLAGSGDMKVRSANVGKVGISVAGSGDVMLAGKCQQLSASIAGSGNIDASDLACAIASIKVAGSGDARVHANESLTVQIAGSGDVTYSGNPPKISKSIAGSGSLTAAK